MGIFPASLDLATLNRDWLPPPEASMGLRYVALEADSITAEFTVSERLLQPHGIMHGGFSCLVGEGLGSLAANLSLNDPRLAAVGQNLQAQHIRPAQPEDVLRARTQAVHIGRRSQIWETDIRHKEGQKLIARINLTIAVIERPGH